MINGFVTIYRPYKRHKTHILLLARLDGKSVCLLNKSCIRCLIYQSKFVLSMQTSLVSRIKHYDQAPVLSISERVDQSVYVSHWDDDIC